LGSGAGLTFWGVGVEVLAVGVLFRLLLFLREGEVLSVGGVPAVAFEGVVFLNYEVTLVVIDF